MNHPELPLDSERLARLGLSADKTAVLLVDHGSRRAESNDLLLEVAKLFQQMSHLPIVEPAHMELAEPSIATAFEKSVDQGADLVIVCPYFLSPGRHWRQDIPALAAEAAKPFKHVRHLVTAPLGLHPLMQHILQDRIVHCLEHAISGRDRCEVCQTDDQCALR